MLWVALQKSIYRSKHVKWKKSSYHKQPQVTLNIVRTCTICFFSIDHVCKILCSNFNAFISFHTSYQLLYEKEHKANTIRSIGSRFPMALLDIVWRLNGLKRPLADTFVFSNIFDWGLAFHISEMWSLSDRTK